jgi:hypothetical protein
MTTFAASVSGSRPTHYTHEHADDGTQCAKEHAHHQGNPADARGDTIGYELALAFRG